jgi:hypothetical protein
MSPERRLQILGADCVAGIHRRMATVPPPDVGTVEEIRQLFAPAVRALDAELAAPIRRREDIVAA